MSDKKRIKVLEAIFEHAGFDAEKLEMMENILAGAKVEEKDGEVTIEVSESQKKLMKLALGESGTGTEKPDEGKKDEPIQLTQEGVNKMIEDAVKKATQQKGAPPKPAAEKAPPNGSNPQRYGKFDLASYLSASTEDRMKNWDQHRTEAMNAVAEASAAQ